MPNRLINATSPYLLQHSNNPVDWHEWGAEAFARAQAEDKPIFLSVGYAACHWCHVMAHESFEDPTIAGILNQGFVSIKVDREERPDVDAIYMDAVVALTHQGGWPMSVFLTPGGEPFYAGTYFPPTERYGMPSFRRVLHSVLEAWENRRHRVNETAAQLTEALGRSALVQPDAGDLSADLLDAAVAALYQSYDDSEGGFGSAPKFPQAMVLEFLLRQYARTGQAGPLAMATHTLRKMANGGMYDQLGGGFHRYSTDYHWLVPHFEKMLYDNALLGRVYLYAWQITGEPLFRRIVEETLDYVLLEMTDSAGGFYSTQDADSEGEEGRFFLWAPDEVTRLLGEDEGALFCRYYDITRQGNFEGKNILHVSKSVEEVARQADVSPEHLIQALNRGRRVLYRERARRVKPGRDEKVLAAWNGLMLRTFAEAGAALGRADYTEAARRNAEFLLERMSDERGRLHRSWKDGRATLNAYLEDYTVVADGLVALYQVTFDERWLAEAVHLLEIVHAHFWDDANGAAFQTSDDHEALIVRRKDFFDNAEPAGNSAYAYAALRLGRLCDRPDLVARCESIFRTMRHPMATQAGGFGYLLSALDLYLRPSREIVVVGDPGDAGARALLDTIQARWLPDAVVAAAAPSGVDRSLVTTLHGRTLVQGRPAAYVCRNYVCKLPVTDPSHLAAQLDESLPAL